MSRPTRGRVSQTVPVSDSGFVDEVPGDREPARRAAPDRAPGAPETPQPEPARRRRPIAAAAFVVVVLALLAFGLYAWSARVHADDEAAYASLVDEIDVMDRTLVPLGHGEVPPCRDPGDGLVTRTYPPSTGPQAAELIGYLTQNGWTRQVPTSPVLARLARTQSGRTVTIDVSAESDSSLVESITAHSPASSFGCLLR